MDIGMERQPPKGTFLNRDALAKIADATAKRRLESAGRTSDVVSVCVLNRAFNRAVLRQVESCDTVKFNEHDVTLCRPNYREGELKLDYKLFADLCTANDLVFPKVVLASGCVRLSNIKLTGIVQLSMHNPQAYALGRLFVLQLASIIEANKSTLKVLLRVPKALFDCVDGLELEKFSVAEDVTIEELKIPALNTKVFECVDIQGSTPIPAPFMRTLGADEIHLKACRIKPLEHPHSDATSNTRVKTLSVTFGNERVTSVRLVGILRDTAACFPHLECLELLHDVYVEDGPRGMQSLQGFIAYVDRLVACFERVLEQDNPVRYRVQLKMMLCYRSWDKLPSTPVASNFACGLRADPPDGVTPRDKNFFCFVKESPVRGHSLRVECKIIQRPQSSDESGSQSSDSE